MRQLQPNIRRYARYQCRRGSAIEDVVQEAMFIVYRRVGDVRSAAALAGWIFKIVARLCMVPALALMRDVEELVAIEVNRYSPICHKTNCAINLVHALKSLPESYRTVILMRDMEQSTIGELRGA